MRTSTNARGKILELHQRVPDQFDREGIGEQPPQRLVALQVRPGLNEGFDALEDRPVEHLMSSD